MKKLLPILLIAFLLGSCGNSDQEEYWTFVSMPDFLNVDCDYPEPLWEDALGYILRSVKDEEPDFLVVPGDQVMGHWDAPNWSDKDTIAKYAERYYSAWINRMNDHDLDFYVTIGDHEVGDNPWFTDKKMKAVKLYKEAFANHFQMPDNGPDHMKGTAFWWRHKNVLFVSVDVFEKGESSEGMIKAGVTGEQLEWLEQVLAENDEVDHRIILGHTPVLGPVRQWSSSGLMIEEGADSDFWKLMTEYEVDAYLCGEVHAVTCTEQDGIMQVAHGGLIGYNTRTNYMVCKVYDDRIDLEIKEIELQPSGEHKWQTKRNRPLAHVDITEENQRQGFYTIGTASIDKSAFKTFSKRQGYFDPALSRSNRIAVPVFMEQNRWNRPTSLPKVLVLPQEKKTISNELLEITIDPDRGTVDLVDLKEGLSIVKDSEIGFSLRRYVDLEELSRIAIETDQADTTFSSSRGFNSVIEEGPLSPTFDQGQSLSLQTMFDGEGLLEVQFTLYPDSSFVEIGFAFENLRKNPVRLHTVTVLSGLQMESLNHEEMLLLGGTSGAGRTEIIPTGRIECENNVLSFFPDSHQERSLVAGGLIYADYRKHISISGDTLILEARDAVGKRIDPFEKYHSDDRFYVDGLTSNPFLALEHYAATSKIARELDIHYYTFPSVCMWFLSVTHFGADPTSENSTVGAVREMEYIQNSGFLKYAPVAIRLVPDNYEQNNQQGWWDDAHWQKYGRTNRCVVDHHYKEPYETTKKWASKIQEMGGIPTTYFQPGIRSEDYAFEYPGHMLYNESQRFVRDKKRVVTDPHVLIGIPGIPDLLNPDDWIDGWGKLYAEAYDYTDPDFLKHWVEVNENLRNGGMQGVFYDYPSRAYPSRGGLEDRYSTATHAYLNVFRTARDVLGQEAYLQERIGIGSDATLPYVSSVRTEGDTNIINTRILNKAANRWYKNRTLTNYDMDGKALVEAGHGEHRYPISARQRRSILTLSYAVSGRLLLTESFSKFSPEVVFDLSRVFPFHASSLSARPLHAFTGGQPVLDFAISDSWHQVILYNDDEEASEFSISLAGLQSEGALGLPDDQSYYVYDFWNDQFGGLVSGKEKLTQEVQAGEARMLSIHAKQEFPQWISTNRHLMQGYADLEEKPVWNPSTSSLSGVSSLIKTEPYKIVVALNGFEVESIEAAGAKASYHTHENSNLIEIVLQVDESTSVNWNLTFSE